MLSDNKKAALKSYVPAARLDFIQLFGSSITDYYYFV